MDPARRPQPGPFPPAAAGIWRLRACPALAPRAWVNSGSALPLQSLSACRALQPGEERTEARASSLCLKIAEQAAPTADIPRALFSQAADFRMPDLGHVERPETPALSSRRDANRHPNTAHFDRGWVVGNLGSGNLKSKSPTPLH